MSLLIISIFALLGIVTGKIIFEKWFNHLTLYCFVMGGLIFFYELKLLSYPDIIPLTWFLIIISSLGFLSGTLTVLTAMKLNKKEYPSFTKKKDLQLNLFADNGRIVKYAILIFGFIGLIAAIQNWMVLIKMFGSIPEVIINANVVYRLNINREIKGVIPYIYIFGYVAIFFAGIYTAYKNKFSILTFFPFIGIIIRELATVGRAGMLFAFLEFLFSFFLFRHLLKSDLYRRFKFSKSNAIFATILLISIIVLSASLVRITRTPGGEKFVGATKEIRELRDNLIISPSVYLYLSSDVGVLNQYLRSEGENTGFGQNTFLPVYNILAKLDVFKRPSEFQKGYYIPMWTNTGTYIRELHADFGIIGVVLIPYLLGLIITWLWFKFYREEKIILLAVLVYLFLIIGFSFLVMITRLTHWFLSLAVILFCLPIMEKLALARKKI